MKSTRRDFLIGSLGLTLGGCATIDTQNPSGNSTSPVGPQAGGRKPSAVNPLGYKLSSPMTEMKSHYDAVVVGSGYGASVMAARLKSKFKNLCILERGKEWHPGDFPDTPNQMNLGALKTPFTPLGLVDIANGQDVDIICGNGLPTGGKNPSAQHA